MNSREAVQIAAKRPERGSCPMCRYYAFKTGCEGCYNAVRLAVGLFEQEEVPQPEWAEKVMERFMKAR